MPNTVIDWLRDRPLALWPVVAIFVALNAWYDYYHPLGAILDGVLVFFVVVALARSRFG